MNLPITRTLLALLGLLVAQVTLALPAALDETGARHLLLRTGFAPTPQEITPLLGLSPAQAVDRLLNGGRPLTAIFAGNDQMAFGAALGLRRRGLRVPDDVSLVGFDDLPTAQYASPPLSTIHQPAYELGRLAATSMLQLLSGTEPTAQVPAPRLVSRESTRNLAG